MLFRSPFRRTAISFDGRDHALDVVVEPDGSWRWKDEDHLELAVAVGAFTPEEAAEIRIPRPDWRLGERTTQLDSLVLFRPGARHSLWHYWADGRFTHWYVNFERHLGRSAIGWDYVDDKLDLVVEASGEWRLKDEDELEQADAAGLVDAGAVRAEAERLLADPPWPTGWEDWRPDPAWPPPQLPDGWDTV